MFVCACARCIHGKLVKVENNAKRDFNPRLVQKLKFGGVFFSVGLLTVCLWWNQIMFFSFSVWFGRYGNFWQGKKRTQRFRCVCVCAFNMTYDKSYALISSNKTSKHSLCATYNGFLSWTMHIFLISFLAVHIHDQNIAQWLFNLYTHFYGAYPPLVYFWDIKESTPLVNICMLPHFCLPAMFFFSCVKLLIEKHAFNCAIVVIFLAKLSVKQVYLCQIPISCYFGFFIVYFFLLWFRASLSRVLQIRFAEHNDLHSNIFIFNNFRARSLSFQCELIRLYADKRLIMLLEEGNVMLWTRKFLIRKQICFHLQMGNLFNSF